VYNSVIKLISETKVVDAYGDMSVVKTERRVFAELKSIGQSEFYQAQAVGLKPEVKFLLPDYLEYNGEKVVRFQDFNEEEPQEYTVLRTYRNNNELELVCRRGID
jgi:SPP1 family predicted phage head-tail adaptor